MNQIEMHTSVLFAHNYKAQTHVVVNQGGSSSGKTYAILQVLFCLAVADKAVITVVGQDIPNLKVGALRHALEIYNQQPALKRKVKKFNRSDRVFEFTNGSLRIHRQG
jgi:phage terminase large subunit